MENSKVIRDSNNDKSVPSLKILVFLNLLPFYNYVHPFISAFTLSPSQVTNLSSLAFILFISFTAVYLPFSFR